MKLTLLNPGVLVEAWRPNLQRLCTEVETPEVGAAAAPETELYDAITFAEQSLDLFNAGAYAASCEDVGRQSLRLFDLDCGFLLSLSLSDWIICFSCTCVLLFSF